MAPCVRPCARVVGTVKVWEPALAPEACDTCKFVENARQGLRVPQETRRTEQRFRVCVCVCVAAREEARGKARGRLRWGAL